MALSLSRRDQRRADAAAFLAHHEADARTLIEQAWTETWQPILDAAAARDAPLTPDDLGTVPAAWQAALKALVLPKLAELYRVGALAGMQDAGVAPPPAQWHALTAAAEPDKITAAFDIVDQRSLDFMAQAENRLRNVGDAAWSNARDSIAQGMLAGEGPTQVADRVQEALDVARNRALVIARTETHGAAEEGSIAGVRALGPDLTPAFKQWVAVMDDRTREEHAIADGQVVPIGEPFDVGGESWDVPGDINCRCDVVFVDTADGEDLGGEWVDGEWMANAPAPDEAVDYPFGPEPLSLPSDTYGSWVMDLQQNPDVLEQVGREKSMAFKVNRDLRDGMSPTDIVGIRGDAGLRMLQVMDETIASAPVTTEDMSFWRGGVLPRLDSVGDRFVDKGYVSVSADPDWAAFFGGSGNIGKPFIVEVPAGSHCAPIDLVFGWHGTTEYEWRLPRGTTYEYRGMREVNGKNVMVVRAVSTPTP